MSNFNFMSDEFLEIKKICQNVEKLIYADPRSSCFNSRLALETMVKWLYRFDSSLVLPQETNLGKLLFNPLFKKQVRPDIFTKMVLIQKAGNIAVHDSEQEVIPKYSLHIAKELHHICHWLCFMFDRTSLDNYSDWNDRNIPNNDLAISPQDLTALLGQAKAFEKQQQEQLKTQAENDKLNQELQALKAELQKRKEESKTVLDTHNYNEAETRKFIIDLDLAHAGWDLTDKNSREYPVVGMSNISGEGFADYVLWGDDGKPLAVIEAKRTTENIEKGQQQAKLYADCLEQMHGQHPVIFYTNGYDIMMWDDVNYPPRAVSGYYKKDELQTLIQRRNYKKELNNHYINTDIAGRPYQTRAITHIFEHFTKKHRKALLVMATGTGKTRTSIALVNALQQAGWVKRALFLADRTSLVNQAINAFKTHLPDSNPVNLLTEKESVGRVYACTYQTMMGLIDKKNSNVCNFGVGHFDLIIIDEAHRSVYQKYGAIFEYFDSLLVGLTATPREEIDRNTYKLFGLEAGNPTDAYELEEAVKQGYLVPPSVQAIDMKFPKDGIKYDELSEEEKARWEELDWAEENEDEEHIIPDRVPSGAINNWLFNTDTVDKALQHLMEYGYKVQDGEQLAKTIIFARNHKHAVFIEERFNYRYPEYKGNFARVIDNYSNYAQSLIDDFSISNKAPHIAISVDMLDTGIDVPEVANLVFFKPVYSKIKFWQMIGRGTRLCPDLFGIGKDKTDFRVFDFCFNFEYFNQQPNGIEGNIGKSLSYRLFMHRGKLLSNLQKNSDDYAELQSSLTDYLQDKVSSMNEQNFMVRKHLQAVRKYQEKAIWEKITEAELAELELLADLPTSIDNDDIESRQLDLNVLKMQLAQLDNDTNLFESIRKRIITVATKLEEKSNIPAVKNAIEYLNRIQQDEFWQDITLDMLEELRLKVRVLMPFIDKKTQAIMTTDFGDTIINITKPIVIPLPKMTSLQYEKRVTDYLKEHLQEPLIKKIHNNKPLTKGDIAKLEEILITLGDDEGQTLFFDLINTKKADNVLYLVRKIIGLDRKAAEKPFKEFIQMNTLNAQQIRFIDLIIKQLTTNGIIDATTLYEDPFTALHYQGVDGIFRHKESMVNALFQCLDEITVTIRQ